MIFQDIYIDDDFQEQKMYQLKTIYKFLMENIYDLWSYTRLYIL